MKIKKVTTSIISVPLKTPFKTALRVVDSINDVCVRIETADGMVGLGEAPPTALITGETIDSVRAAIEGFIAPKIIGRSVMDFEDLMEAAQRALIKNTSAKAAVDMALYDIMAQALNLPLYRLLGGSRTELESDVTISLNDTDQMIADSMAAVENGFRILKIKTGKSGLKDAYRVTEIRQAVGSAIELRVDANQGWTPKESVRIIQAMEDGGCGASLVEQPVNAHDIDGLRYVTQNTATPILADEAVFSPSDAIEIIRTGAADMINIKLMKTGGIHEALKICDIAGIYGTPCMMGCMLESRLSTAAAAHLAAAKHIISMVDLDGPMLCASDPFTGGPNFSGARIKMSDDPGVGIIYGLLN
ncbi:MAG: dipeptide epimerase [Clostridiales bacterium]|nr:dipeptide epimerase [Clostridiales bacterium]